MTEIRLKISNPEIEDSSPVAAKPPEEPPAEATDFVPRWERMPVERRVDIALVANSTDGVELGDVLFLDDGSASLGNKVFAGGVEIINHTWGDFVANREGGADQLLAIGRPDGEIFYYCYQHTTWYRFVPLVAQHNILLHTLSEQVRQFGLIGACLHWAFDLLRGAFIFAVTAAICFGVLAALAWARS